MTKPFIAQSSQWHRNLRDSERVSAGPAVRIDLEGNRHPGVVMRMGEGRLLILDPADALRLANNLADALAENKSTTTERNRP